MIVGAFIGIFIAEEESDPPLWLPFLGVFIVADGDSEAAATGIGFSIAIAIFLGVCVLIGIFIGGAASKDDGKLIGGFISLGIALFGMILRAKEIKK